MITITDILGFSQKISIWKIFTLILLRRNRTRALRPWLSRDDLVKRLVLKKKQSDQAHELIHYLQFDNFDMREAQYKKHPVKPTLNIVYPLEALMEGDLHWGNTAD